MKKLIVVVVIGIAIAWYFLAQPEEGDSYSQEIFSSEVDRGDITRSVATSGSVRPLVTVEVGSQLSGQIAELYADYNTQVKKDQLIALIDPQTFEKRVRQAEADLKVAEANVTVQKANIMRAEANLRRARLDYERQKPLVEKGTLPATDLDSALASFDSAQADLEIAKAQLRNAEANVEQREAALETANIDLDRTNIRSPIDGVVIDRSVDVGQTVAASMSAPILFNIAQDLRQIQLEASVDETDIGNVSDGNAVTFTVDAYPDDSFRGMVQQVRLAPEESQNVVTYTVIVSARNPDLKLLPGMTANMEIITGKRENVVRVENDALRFKPRDAEALAGNNASPGGFGGGAPGQGGGGFGGSGGGGPSQMLMKRLEPLQLSAEKTAAIEKGIAESFASMRDEMFGGGGQGGVLGGMPRPPGGFDRSEMVQRIENMVERVLERHLTPEQMAKWRQSGNNRREVRRGEVWVQAEDGQLQRRSVMLGISDSIYTEVINDDLEPGTVVVTRIREKKI